MNKVNLILKVAVALSLLVVSGTLGYRYLFYLPQVEEYRRCLSTYPSDWKNTSMSQVFPGWTIQEFCENGVTYGDFSLFVGETTREILKEVLRELGHTEEELETLSDEEKEIIKEHIKDRLKKLR